jgi:hypothetical protein
MKHLNKQEIEVLSDGVLLYIEQLNLKILRGGGMSNKLATIKDKQRFNCALDIAKKLDLDILDWEEQRYV